MVSAIIVAAGKGLRMKGDTRKQYLDLLGKPVLAHSIAVFDACNLIDDIIVIVPEEDIAYCQKEIISPLQLKNRVRLVSGGDQRQASVYNGLQAVDPKSLTVVIHDGVRPFVRPEELAACISGAKKYGACILGFPASDTLKQVNKSGIIEKTLPRENVWLVQTPQAFQYGLIMEAHETARRHAYTGTDDASLVEKMGKDIKIINGSRHNIKITTREDLILVRAVFDSKAINNILD